MLNRKVFGLGLMALIVAPSALHAETVLRLNRWLPPKHFLNTELMQKWANDVKAVTNGRVRVIFTTKSLGRPPRQFDLAREGVADLTWGTSAYIGAPRFVLPEIAELPLTGESGEALSVAYWRTHVKYFHKAREYRGTKVIAVHTHAQGGAFTNGKPIKTLSDFRGMKIRVPNPTTSRLLQKFGGVPISGTVSKVYEMLSKGVIDGTFFSADSIIGFRLYPFIKHATHIRGGFFNASFFFVMNQRKWDALSKRDQKAIEGVSGEKFAALAGSVWDQKAQAAMARMKAAGVTINLLGTADRAALATQAKAIERAWIAAASKKGVDAEAALKYFRAQATAYKPMKK